MSNFDCVKVDFIKNVIKVLLVIGCEKIFWVESILVLVLVY